MIRERRNKEKLALYYKKFMEEGIVDPNVHPWVAESWQRCRKMRLPHETMPKINKLSREEIIEHQKMKTAMLSRTMRCRFSSA